MKNATNIIQVNSKMIPVISIDSESKAVYIKFSTNKVAKTIDDSEADMIVTIDIDSNNDVVGVELIGVKNFTITTTLKLLSKKIKDIPDLTKAQLTAY